MARDLLILEAFLNIGIHRMPLRGEGLNLELPNFNLKVNNNSFTYSLTKLWNSLPSQMRLSSDANDFKSKLHDCSFLERVLQCMIVAF